MVKHFLDAPLSEQLFWVLLAVIVVVFIKAILLVAALALLVYVLADVVFSENTSDESVDSDSTL